MDAEFDSQTGRKILILEQDEYLASLLDMLLHREGYAISALTSDAGLREYIQQSTPVDLIFIDSSWLSGEHATTIDVFTHKIEWQRIPMIMLLGYYDPEMIERAMSFGVSDYLLQPFEPGELLDLIRRYI